jgi:hypothetical protein
MASTTTTTQSSCTYAFHTADTEAVGACPVCSVKHAATGRTNAVDGRAYCTCGSIANPVGRCAESGVRIVPGTDAPDADGGDDRPYCCRTFATGRCSTCIEEMALDAENRWQNGPRDPERALPSFATGPDEDEAPGAGTYEDHLLYSGIECDRCGAAAGVEMAEVADGTGAVLFVHVACMKDGDAVA